MLEELKKIYEDNSQWLNFAELKNGAMTTLMVALLAILTEIEAPIVVKSFFISFSLIIIGLSILSFIPFLNKNLYIKRLVKIAYRKSGNSLEKNNIVFYVNIFLSDKDIYKRALSVIVTGADTYSFNNLEENYIDQIIEISTIAAVKYFIFKWSVRLFYLMLLCAIVTVIAA